MVEVHKTTERKNNKSKNIDFIPVKIKSGS